MSAGNEKIQQEAYSPVQPSSESQVEVLLSRFPGPVRLRVIPKSFGGLLLFPALTAMFVGVIVHGDNPIVGWMGAVAFSLLTIVSAVGTHPSAGGLVLDAESLQQGQLFFTFRSTWRDVDNFTISRIVSPFSGKVTPVIWYHDRRRENWWFRWFWKLSKFNAGVNPVDELSIEELAAVITRWRERALAQALVKQ